MLPHRPVLFEIDGLTVGVVGCAVGSSFAVLVAEELFASGCGLLISITSSGQLVVPQAPPYFILIERALRDEGTSYHYLPPASYSYAPEDLISALEGAFDDLGVPVLRGATWTTDAPFRETRDAIESMRERGLLAVEMEAAALYAFAKARGKAMVCFAHVTNQMGQIEGARRHGKKLHAKLSSAIFAASIGGLRSGEPGKPFDVDLKMRAYADEQLARLSRADAAYELYRSRPMPA